MRFGILVAVLCIVVLSSAACAGSVRITDRIDIIGAMAGNAYVANPAASTAWANNPAGLAALAGMSPTNGRVANGWRHAGSGTVEVSGDANLWGFNWGGTETGKDFGLGAGWNDAWDTREWGVGFGKSWPKKGISWGVNLRHVDPNRAASNNLFDIGMLGQTEMPGSNGRASMNYGVVVRDITDEFARSIDLGISLPLPKAFRLGVDLVDVTDEADRRLRLGVTKRLGSQNEWEVGVGFDDGDPTLGFMYDVDRRGKWGGAWRVGAAWQEQDRTDDALLVGASATWGFGH